MTRDGSKSDGENEPQGGEMSGDMVTQVVFFVNSFRRPDLPPVFLLNWGQINFRRSLTLIYKFTLSLESHQNEHLLM